MSSKMVNGMMACLVGAILIMIAICVCYLPSMMSAEIAYKRAATKVLSGLDLQDAETRRALRGLLGVEEDE